MLTWKFLPLPLYYSDSYALNIHSYKPLSPSVANIQLITLLYYTLF